MSSIRQALVYQSDFQLLSASAWAGQFMHQCITGANTPEQAEEVKMLANLLRLAHVRQRFMREDQLQEAS